MTVSSGPVWQGSGTALGIPLFEKYVLFADRLMIRRGLFSSREDETTLYRIVDITLERTLIQRLLGFGTVVLRAVDVTDPVIKLKGIRRSSEVRDTIRQSIQAERHRLGIEGTEMRGAADTIEHHP